MRYINKARLDIQTLLDFDLNRLKFDFKDAHAMLNALELGFDGWFEMPESDINFDLTFYSKKAEFKTILSLVPAIYMADFESLKTSGNLSLKGFAKELMGKLLFLMLDWIYWLKTVCFSTLITSICK
jgi:hypothetical protein